MSAGTYLLSGPDGPYAVERFSCGAGPAGWRYVARREQPGTGAPLGRLDVVLGPHGAVLRAHVEGAGWVLRGGAVGPELLWRRGDEERSAPAQGFTGTSPVWALAATRLAAAAAGPLVRLRLVRLGDEALATQVVEQAWACTGVAPAAGPAVTGWERTDLETGERGAVRVAGDLVLVAPGAALTELADA